MLLEMEDSRILLTDSLAEMAENFQTSWVIVPHVSRQDKTSHKLTLI